MKILSFLRYIFLLRTTLLIEKQIRDENIRNFIKILKVHLANSKEMTVFSGKIGVFNKKHV